MELDVKVEVESQVCEPVEFLKNTPSTASTPQGLPMKKIVKGAQTACVSSQVHATTVEVMNNTKLACTGSQTCVPVRTETNSQTDCANSRILRCIHWLQQQNNEDPKKASLQNKNVNDIQFILQTNAERRNFLRSSAEDDGSVPVGVDERAIEPKVVHVQRLHFEQYRSECEWKGCGWIIEDYDLFQRHVSNHIVGLQVVDGEYQCQWDVCGHKTEDHNEIVRHINYHAYHAKLLAIGFNARATLQLERCKKDSRKRNTLPPLKSDHICMWTQCRETFNSFQRFLDHVRQHVNYASPPICSWAGCGAPFARRVSLRTHARSHTAERPVACYHCGRHFAGNRKLAEHIQRQNADPSSGYNCAICGAAAANAYLLREHSRKHVSLHACSLCDMTATTPSSLAMHVRYRHLGNRRECRTHPCPHCPYRAITKWDLRKHIPTHFKTKKPPQKKKQRKIKTVVISSDQEDSENELSDEENTVEFPPKKPGEVKKYICHMCPESETKIFTRGSRLTTHLVKVHGAQWPYGHCRFRYQISDDGLYRLTTTRYESLEVSKNILDCTSGPKPPNIDNTFEFDLIKKSEATMNTPIVFEIALREPGDVSKQAETKSVEIEMCDVDEDGNIITLQTIKSDVYYA